MWQLTSVLGGYPDEQHPGPRFFSCFPAHRADLRIGSPITRIRSFSTAPSGRVINLANSRSTPFQDQDSDARASDEALSGFAERPRAVGLVPVQDACLVAVTEESVVTLVGERRTNIATLRSLKVPSDRFRGWRPSSCCDSQHDVLSIENFSHAPANVTSDSDMSMWSMQEDDNTCTSAGLAVQPHPISQTSSWSHLSSLPLFSADGRGGGCYLRRVYACGDPAQPRAMVLSSYSLHLLDIAKGSQLEMSESIFFEDPLARNAIVADVWGPHGCVVGFSDGQVRLYDWRQPLLSSEDGTPAALVTTAPQPLWLADRRRRIVCPATGILSCCTLQENYRVVCGLADPRGSIVVADVRVPVAEGVGGKRRAKRGRLSTAEAATERILNGTFAAPTGAPIVDMQHSKDRFGVLGMVDGNGHSTIMTISELENTQNNHVNRLGRGGAKTYARNSNTCPLLGELPPPHEVVARTQGLRGIGYATEASRAPAPPLNPISRAAHSQAMRESTRNAGFAYSAASILTHPARCAFLPGGRYLINSQMPLSVYRDNGDLSYRPGMAIEQTGVETELGLLFFSVASRRTLQRACWTQPHDGTANISVVALMTSRNMVLVEMSNGETLWVSVAPAQEP